MKSTNETFRCGDTINQETLVLKVGPRITINAEGFKPLGMTDSRNKEFADLMT